MIGKHCGEYLVHHFENKKFFTRKCTVCWRFFTQRKRQSKKDQSC